MSKISYDSFPPLSPRLHYWYRLYVRYLRPGKFKRYQTKRNLPSSDNNSCRPFDERRCIFVHIPKCAGISVSRSLFGNVSGAHLTLKQFQIMFSPEDFSEYFKFSFVRNPWDRLVSAFHFLKKGGITPRDKEWSETHLAPFADFDAFVRGGIQQKKIRSLLHFRPQCDFICLAGKRPGLNFIGFYENLDADFAYICHKLNLDRKLLAANRNPSRKKDYREYYNDETREIVGRIYADDVKVLGYSFDNSTPPPMLAGRANFTPISEQTSNLSKLT